MHFWMEWKNIPCRSTHKKQYFVTKQKKGTVVLNYMNTNVVYLKNNKNTDWDVHNILLCATIKIPNI